MIKPYDIFLDEEITRYLEDTGYLINKKSKKKEEVMWHLGGLLCVGDCWYTGKELLENFEFADGSPCGILIKDKENIVNLENLFD